MRCFNDSTGAVKGIFGGRGMKRIFIPLLMCFFLAGCGTVYTNPAKSEADFNKDKSECEMAAKKDLAAGGIPETCNAINERMKRCMEKRGWKATDRW